MVTIVRMRNSSTPDFPDFQEVEQAGYLHVCSTCFGVFHKVDCPERLRSGLLAPTVDELVVLPFECHRMWRVWFLNGVDGLLYEHEMVVVPIEEEQDG